MRRLSLTKIKKMALLGAFFVSGTACAIMGLKHEDEMESNLVQMRPEKYTDTARCKIITAKPALYRCFTPEGAVCYVAHTGISCLPFSGSSLSVAKH